ncbi:MAG: Ribosomal protein S12 methylthiotransferase RimO [Promethearchaeota archaeon]|nr:MAG: Ribosomal protein S12 methylthiotransferase RimO [Candidatus Lokiarchaeota archaeon]
MNILYINPARISAGLDYVIQGPPLGLVSIAAMVPDHESKLIDFKVDNYSDEAFRSELNHADLVAITSMTPQIENAFETAKIAKEQGCETIIGGYHPTLDPTYVIKNPSVDYAIRGEGEHTFYELVSYINQEQHSLNELKKIKGISFKENGKLYHNDPRPLEPNLDNFPMPRRDLIDDSKYVYLGARVAQLETSRGCPHSCKFCCIAQMWKDKRHHLLYRTKSIKRIMQEIYDIDWKNDFIFFCEDNFTIQPKRTKKILKTIIQSGVQHQIYFSCQSRVDTLYHNPEIIDLMDKAGMKQVFLGVESVHQQSLNAMNKRNTTPKMTKQVIEELQERGISIFGGVIIGYPGETKTMVRRNIAYAKSLNMTCVQFTPITAFPGTEFYDEMKKEGKVTSNNYKHYNLFHSMMRTDELTNREIYRLVGEAYASYYLSGYYMKLLAKRYANPLSKFNWMFKRIPSYVKRVMKNGVQMLHTQGISSNNVSEELKAILENHHLR